MKKKREDSRGIYRAIYVSLWDDPEFLKLPPEAKLVFLNLRTGPLSNMPCVYRFYKDAIREQTGYSDTVIDTVLDTLSNTGWIEVEQNIVWVKNALRYDPNIFFNNPLHVQAVKNIILGLPKLKIIIDFCTYYGIKKPYELQRRYGMAGGMGKGIGNGMVITEKEKEKEKEKENNNIPAKKVKKAYGEFSNVLLTNEELEKLNKTFGEKGAQDRIQNLSEYLASKGKKYSNHYATIKTWERRNNPKKKELSYESPYGIYEGGKKVI